jgi:predicted nucleic acid-binding protein
MLILDSNAVIALFRRQDPFHRQATEIVMQFRPPLVLPAGVIAECTYFLESRSTSSVLDAFIASLESGTLTLDCGQADFTRIRELVSRYADLPLGYADSSVIACAERRRAAVLTNDLRHFGVVAREGTFRIAGYDQ